MSLSLALEDLYQVILHRKHERPKDSYTTYLFEKGLDKILKKVGEESAETIIASKNGRTDEIVLETTDLIYHLMVMLAWHDISPEQVMEEVRRRADKGRLKEE